jgi:transposase-like protein
MAQHFLLSAKARTLSLRSIYAGGEEKAYETFKRLRWPETDGEPVCPTCGSIDHYTTARRRFACKACRKQYSVTSGTIFASRKMSFTDLLAAICIVVNAAKGVSALQLARDIDCQHKTAFVLGHKIREALAAELRGAMVNGDVEIDGAYFGGHVRPERRGPRRSSPCRASNRQAPRRDCHS